MKKLVLITDVDDTMPYKIKYLNYLIVDSFVVPDVSNIMTAYSFYWESAPSPALNTVRIMRSTAVIL